MKSPIFAIKAFTPANVRYNPKISTGWNVRGGGGVKLKSSPSKDEEKMKGGLLIRYLWTQGTVSIHDMRVMNTYAPFYLSKTPEKFLETAEK